MSAKTDTVRDNTSTQNMDITATGDHKRKVYICHSSDDREQVEVIVNKLEQEYHVPCILDIRDFVGGRAVVNNMFDFIKSAAKMVLALSRSFLENSFCQYEMTTGLQENIIRSQNFLVPILLEDCDVPDMVKTMTCLDFKHPDFWRKFLVSLGYENESGIPRHNWKVGSAQREEGIVDPRLTVVTSPTSNVCTGFRTPDHPHPKSDHCVALAMKQCADVDDIYMCDLNDDKCDYTIKLLDVTRRRLSQNGMETNHELRTRSRGRLCDPSTRVEGSPGLGHGDTGVPGSYRVWDGHKKYPGNPENTISHIFKPWICLYWFRFFGKACTYELDFGLFKKGQRCDVLLDRLTIIITTKGKRPSKSRDKVNSVQFGMPLVEYKGIFKRKVYEDALRTMYELLCLGNGEELEKTCEKIYQCFRDKSADIQIMSLCYTVSALCTHTNDVDRSNEILDRAKRLLPHAQNRQLLEAKIESVLGYAYRKDGQLGTALYHLQKAYQTMLLVKPCAFRGECLYHLSSLKFETLKGQTVPPQTVYQSILAELDRATDLMETESKLTITVRQRFMIKKALILADRSSRCLQLQVPAEQLNEEQDQLKEAEKLLHHVEYNGELESVSFQYIKCCLLQGKVTVFRAKRMYDKAKEYADTALEIAEGNGFTGEIKNIKKMIDSVQSQCVMKPAKPVIEVIEDSLSDAYFGDCSSGADDDIVYSQPIYPRTYPHGNSTIKTNNYNDEDYSDEDDAIGLAVPRVSDSANEDVTSYSDRQTTDPYISTSDCISSSCGGLDATDDGEQ